MINYGRIQYVFLAIIILVLLLTGGSVRGLLSEATQAVKGTAISINEGVENFFARHFRQTEMIKTQSEEIERMQKELLDYRARAKRLDWLERTLPVDAHPATGYRLVGTLGYMTLGATQRLWLAPFEKFDSEKIYGAVSGQYAVGIIVGLNGRPMLLLGGDRECSFAVTIGENEAPGIAVGKNSREMIVKYIPQWMKIEIGDEVFSSGLDMIFPPGIPVGKVLSVQPRQGFQNALIRLYGNTLHPAYVWVSDTSVQHSLPKAASKDSMIK